MFAALRKLLAGWFSTPAETQAHIAKAENSEISRSTVKFNQIDQDDDDLTPLSSLAGENLGEERRGHVVPYDEHLLERTRTQWRQGEWESLVRLDMNSIEHHPERAKLGLVVASAWLQQGDDHNARRYLRQALDWGCDRKLLAQILCAGVHNTIGRASAIAGDRLRMERHFIQAVKGGGSSSVDGASLVRRHAELRRLGLNQSEVLQTPEPSLAQPPVAKAESSIRPPRGIVWHVLWAIDTGFYLDIRSAMPATDPVGQAFHDHGWQGLDIVLQPEADTRLEAPIMTLSEAFDRCVERETHWLKIEIDILGSDFLTAWEQRSIRPWVVVLESMAANCIAPLLAEFENHLKAQGYRFIHTDEKYRFYVHQSHQNLATQFNASPNNLENLVSYSAHECN